MQGPRSHSRVSSRAATKIGWNWGCPLPRPSQSLVTLQPHSSVRASQHHGVQRLNGKHGVVGDKKRDAACKAQRTDVLFYEEFTTLTHLRQEIIFFSVSPEHPWG